MTLAIQILVLAALVMVNVGLARWLWRGWRDHRDELAVPRLVEELIAKNKIIREIKAQIVKLQEFGVEIQRQVWLDRKSGDRQP